MWFAVRHLIFTIHTEHRRAFVAVVPLDDFIVRARVVTESLLWSEHGCGLCLLILKVANGRAVPPVARFDNMCTHVPLAWAVSFGKI